MLTLSRYYIFNIWYYFTKKMIKDKNIRFLIDISTKIHIMHLVYTIK